MVSYGMAKVIPLQMPAPGLARLLEPFGNLSPMGVLWASIGASPTYEIFTGAIELARRHPVVPARGLRLLGALISPAAHVTQVFVLNMTYDVPVKLFSFHLLVMSLVLLAPEARRLLKVLMLNRRRRTIHSQLPLTRSARAASGILVAAQVVFGALISVFMNLYQARAELDAIRRRRAEVRALRNLERRAACRSTASCARRSSPTTIAGAAWSFNHPTSMPFHRMDDTLVRYGTAIETTAKHAHAEQSERQGLDGPIHIRRDRPPIVCRSLARWTAARLRWTCGSSITPSSSSSPAASTGCRSIRSIGDFAAGSPRAGSP